MITPEDLLERYASAVHLLRVADYVPAELDDVLFELIEHGDAWRFHLLAKNASRRLFVKLHGHNYHDYPEDPPALKDGV